MRFSIFLAIGLTLFSCRAPNQAGQLEKENCPDPDGPCSVGFTKFSHGAPTTTTDSSASSGTGVEVAPGVALGGTTGDTRDPNSGSGGALITKEDLPSWLGGPSTGGGDDNDNGTGNGGGTRPEEEITTTNPGSGDGTVGPITGPRPWDNSGKDNGSGGGGNGFLDVIGGGIAGAVSTLAGEITGKNDKKRKKAREGQKAIDDAKDTLKQADDYKASITLEMDEISRLSGTLSLSQAPLANNVFMPQLQRMIDTHNQKKERVINDTRDPDIEPAKIKTETAASGRVETQKMAAGRGYVKYAKEEVEKLKGQADYQVRKELVNVSDEAMNAASESYAEGNQDEGNLYYELGMVAADIALSLTPGVGLGKDIYELGTGRSLVDGKALSGYDRAFAAVGVMTLGLGKIGVFSKVGKLGKIFGKIAANGDEAAKAGKALEKAESLAAAANKAGVTEKKLLDDISKIVKDGLPCSIVRLSPIRKLLWLVEDTAYAGDCIPGSPEDLLKKTLDTAAKLGVPASDIPRVANKVNHVFGNKTAGHKLEKVLDSFGGDGFAAVKGIENSLQTYVDTGKLTNGTFDGVKVMVNSFEVTTRGNVINNVVKLGTAFIP